MSPAGLGPEAKARKRIDEELDAAGWVLQDRDEINLAAGLGVAIREFKLTEGYADYLLFVDGKPVGVLEAKKAGYTLGSVEQQAKAYTEGLPPNLIAPIKPLPFMYMSTGDETKFANLLDPHPRTRRVFNVHRPETLAEWLSANTLDAWVKSTGAYTAANATKPSTLRARLSAMPTPELHGMWPSQRQALINLEHSLRQDKPRALIQMATGSGKTLLAVASIYRLIKFGGARRVLFLVDRGNLGEKTEPEFEGYRTPDDGRKFIELYTVQRLKSNTIGSSSKVVITTIQRLYSMLRGETEFDAALEEGSLFQSSGFAKEPVPVAYNKAIPPEFFDVIFVDECHRSIYSLWRQVLEYFDAHLVGLTATPAKHTFGFFNQNLVMEYGHEEAVADGCNVDFEVYKVRTKITAGGSTVEAEDGTMLGLRDRRTRQVRWEQPDEDLTYAGSDLDRNIVAKDQIRLIVRTFRAKVLKEAFPSRTEVPKTLIFAKDDSHAEDILEIVREEFGRGNEFAQKITYKTTGAKPKQLIQDFRTSYFPRVVVTVDLIATGTDIRPIEIVMFMRSVKSRVLFEQMKGRGVRVIDKNELRAVTPDATAKTHFLIVDCVGVTESKLEETQPLERKKHTPLKNLFEHIAVGGTEPDTISAVASRLSRLDKECDPEQQKRIAAIAGRSLKQIAHAMVDALNPDRQAAEARSMHGLAGDQSPTEEQIKQAAQLLLKKAVEPIATKPELRKLLIDLRREFDQIIDEVSKDELLKSQTGMSADAKQRAQSLVNSFEEFIKTHKDEIDALQFFFSVPHKERLRFKDVKMLAEAISAPPRTWTAERLWHAYELLDKNRVRGASAQRLLTDIVSLIRFALHQDEKLVPHAERVHERFENWMAQQANTGRQFTPEQRHWLEMMRDHVATSMEIDVDDFDATPFSQEGGLGKASQIFGNYLGTILNELNEVLAA